MPAQRRMVRSERRLCRAQPFPGEASEGVSTTPSGRDGALLAAGDADDAMEGGLGDVEGTRAVEHDAAWVTQLTGHRAHLAGRRDSKDLTDLESAAHEHAAIGSDGEVGPMVVAGGQSDNETQVAVGSEAEHFPDRAQEDEVVTGSRRHADQSPERLLAHVDHLGFWQDRDEEIDASGQRPVLTRINPEDQRALIPFVDEPTERRRERCLRPQIRLRTRVVEEDESPLPVEGERAATEEVVQSHRHRLEPLVRAKSIDAIAVLLAEEEVPALRIEREAAEHGLSRPIRERHQDAGRPRGVYRQVAPEVNAIDFGGGSASPVVAP